MNHGSSQQVMIVYFHSRLVQTIQRSDLIFLLPMLREMENMIIRFFRMESISVLNHSLIKMAMVFGTIMKNIMTLV
ncbi:MAG: hypothetical protein M5T52_06055 [Ignavibacteriaceae bacterium]|nr:hypothetical protein [Ignavibacteriaceae bacterium]